MVLYSADEVQQLVFLVQGPSFALSLLAGILVHRGHFCTMGAISDWMVMRDAVTLSQTQIDALAAAYEGNARPLQPIGDRDVVLDTQTK